MIRRCVNCDCELNKHDIMCPSCHSTDIIRKGLFWYKVLGVFIGLIIPSLINIILVLFFSDKRVTKDFLNASILWRSKWLAMRKGIIAGFILHFLVLAVLICILISMLSQRYSDIFNMMI